MSLTTIASLAAQFGLPVLTNILAGKIGGQNADLVNEIALRIAQRVGVETGDLDDYARNSPGAVKAAMVEVEREAPEMVGVAMKALEGQFALLLAEKSDPIWMRAWRPLGMYMLGFLWVWNIVVLHCLNAIFKIALPAVDFGVLLNLTVLYFGLYMGGHTVKSVAANLASVFGRAGVRK